jgi:hypothetical protein
MAAPKQLHIIGNEESVRRYEKCRLGGERISWGDCLHVGPVPAGLSLEEMSRMRARFVADNLDGRPFDGVLAEFNARDHALKDFKRFDEVLLWFGRGVDDQLRLLQLLTWFAQRELGRTRLLLCREAARPGEAGPEEIAAEERQLARQAWDAFCSEKPLDLAGLVRGELPGLPDLRAALLRMLEQFPSARDGLSRTEQQILRAAAPGPVSLEAVYRASQIEMEELPFIVERLFLYEIKRLSSGKPNLVEFVDGPPLADDDGPPYRETVLERRVQLTDIGRKIMMGQADCVRLYGIDRWVGGVRLRGTHAAWRWDNRRQVIVALSA